MSSNNARDIKSIGIPFYNVRSWYFRRPFTGPEHWDTLTEGIQAYVTAKLETGLRPDDYWVEISRDQVANVIATVRGENAAELELSLNRFNDLFCLSLSVIDFDSAEQHELADEIADKLNRILREGYFTEEEIWANPF
jgi:hypothetical protein